MPELPEVQCMVNRVAPWVLHKTIRSFEATWPRQVLPSVAQVTRGLKNQRIEAVLRRGKHLVFELQDKSAMLLHLKMSGRLELLSLCQSPPRHVRAHFGLNDGDQLLFCDARKFGRIQHTRDWQASLAHLGPEPLADGFSWKDLKYAFGQKKRPMKALLLDQTVLSGLGNIYADESLFAAKIHPLRISHTLGDQEIKNLHRAIRHTLNKAIRLCGTSLDWVYPGGQMQTQLRAYGRTGQACPRCKSKIQKISVVQRGTHYCAHCQS